MIAALSSVILGNNHSFDCGWICLYTHVHGNWGLVDLKAAFWQLIYLTNFCSCGHLPCHGNSALVQSDWTVSKLHSSQQSSVSWKYHDSQKAVCFALSLYLCTDVYQIKHLWKICDKYSHGSCTAQFVAGTLSYTPVVWTELKTLDFSSKGPCNLIQKCVHFVTAHTSFTSNHFTKQFLCSYILIIKANKMHYFSNLFDKVLYMFRTGPLSIIRSISTLYTCNRYLSC
jgi:hypothetical protein